MQKVIEKGRKTDSGRQYAVDAAEAAEKARMGARNDVIARQRQIAETELTANKEFEKFNPWAEAAAQAPGADDARTILINQRAIRRARAELGESVGPLDATKAVNQKLTDDLLRDLNERRELLPEKVKIRNMQRFGGMAVKDDEPVDLEDDRRAIRRARATLGEQTTESDVAAAGSMEKTEDLLRQLLVRISSLDEQTKAANLKKAEKPGGPLSAKPTNPLDRI